MITISTNVMICFQISALQKSEIMLFLHGRPGLQEMFKVVAQMVKKSAYNKGDLSLIPGLGRSPGEEIGYPL